MPSLNNLEEDIVIKAAILSTSGHYAFKLSDFRWRETEEAGFAQNVIWAIEALQGRYPGYLQYARWVAIKEAIGMLDRRRKGKKKTEENQPGFPRPDPAPRPEMGKLMQEEWDRHFAGYRYRRMKQNRPEMNQLSKFLNDLAREIRAKTEREGHSSNKPAETIPVDIDGKGSVVMMTPEQQAIWKSFIGGQPPGAAR